MYYAAFCQEKGKISIITGNKKAMKEEKITEENIKLLVDSFYSKVKRDQNLSPIFENAIGSDDEMWRPHLERMYKFWSSVALSTGLYSGNPFQKHKDLPSFDISLFDRWLELFFETTKEVYIDDLAQIFITKSTNITRSLKLGLYSE